MINSSQTIKKRRKYLKLFFAKECSLVNTNSDPPSVLSKETHKVLSTMHFTSDEILKIIQNFDLNKAHDHDMITIRMTKIRDASICKSLELIFRSRLENRKFPTEWKKANVVQAHKKRDKQNLKNYRPVSVLPVVGKIFERILYNIMCEFFTENNLISAN